MAGDEYKNLLAGYSPEHTGVEPNQLGGGGSSLAELLQRYGPLGSHAMAQRGPWMRDYMPASLADFLAAMLQYGPPALPALRAGAVRGNDAAMVATKEQKALLAPGPYDWGITGGNPNAASAYAARSAGRNPVAIWERSSSDLGTRPGVKSLPELFALRRFPDNDPR